MSRPPKPVKYVKKPNVLEVGGSDGRSGELADGPRSISQLRPRRSVSKTSTSTPPASSLHKSKIAGKRSRKNCGGPGRKSADGDAPGLGIRPSPAGPSVVRRLLRNLIPALALADAVTHLPAPALGGLGQGT